MTIWLLAIILLASLAGFGYRQGAIRVGISFFGILIGALVAPPLGHLATRLLANFGLKQPLLGWMLGPLLVFVIISAIFKAIAAVVHQKVDVYYKYKAGDLRLALWERLNHRLGLCVGLLNGTAYLILIAFVVYVFSYWTAQMSSGDNDPKTLRLVNRMGKDLQNSGFDKVASSVEHMPAGFFEAADIAGLLYNNSLLEARLSRYPGFLKLSESPQFQALGSDKDFTEMLQRQEPIASLLRQGSAAQIVDNPELMHDVWTTAAPDLKDLRAYLETGLSAKYDSQKILGRWDFDVTAALRVVRRAKPNMTSSDMQKWKKYFGTLFDKTSLVAMADQSALLKNLPSLKPGAAAGGAQTLDGTWKDLDGGKYQLSLSGMELPATLDRDRLTIKAEGMDLVFSRED